MERKRMWMASRFTLWVPHVPARFTTWHPLCSPGSDEWKMAERKLFNKGIAIYKKDFFLVQKLVSRGEQGDPVVTQQVSRWQGACPVCLRLGPIAVVRSLLLK